MEQLPTKCTGTVHTKLEKGLESNYVPRQLGVSLGNGRKTHLLGNADAVTLREDTNNLWFCIRYFFKRSYSKKFSRHNFIFSKE